MLLDFSDNSNGTTGSVECTQDSIEDDENTSEPISAANTIVDKSICPAGDKDFFTFSLDTPTPKNIEIVVSFDIVNDLSLNLYRTDTADPSIPIFTSFSDNAMETISLKHEFTDSKDYIIEVLGADDTVTGDYTINLDIVDSPEQ